jgi:hypothetical protein
MRASPPAIIPNKNPGATSIARGASIWIDTYALQHLGSRVQAVCGC